MYINDPALSRRRLKVVWPSSRVMDIFATVEYMPSHKTPSVPALAKALTLLETIAQSRRGMSLSHLSRELQLPKSSTHCLLLTLERHGYLQRNNQTRRYTFGLKFYSLASTALAQMRIRDIAAPLLHSLMKQTGLTVHMAVLEGGEAVLIDKVEPPGLITLATWIGKRMDVHCTGVGKSLIAYLSESELDSIVIEHRLSRHNENTITSAGKLKNHLALIRKQGYSLDDEEDELGLRCISSAVLDHTGKAIAAISVAGPTSRITAENVHSLANKVKHTAAAISQQFGH